MPLLKGLVEWYKNNVAEPPKDSAKVAKKATHPPVKGSIRYTGQRGKLKGSKIIIDPNDPTFTKLKSVRWFELNKMRQENLTNGQWAVREMLLDNRRWQRKKNKTRVADHFGLAIKRGVARSV
jgi:hypothetical protein